MKGGENMKNKILMISIVSLFSLFLISNVLAETNSTDLQSQIDSLQSQVNNLSNTVILLQSELNNITLTPGVNGTQGPQGLQGIAGTNATVNLTPILDRLNALELFEKAIKSYPGFSDFVVWLGVSNPCMNGQFQCSGNSQQKCVNYVWINQQTCQYGCNNGTCNTAICTAGTKQCSGNTTQVCVNNTWVTNATCQYGCTNGTCNTAPIVCSANSQCGTDVFTGSLTCQSGNVYQNKLTFTCNNPGKSGSSCSNATSLTLKQACSYGCINGVCNTKEDCTKKGKVGISCSSVNDKYVNKYKIYLGCKTGHGTKESCDIGYCNPSGLLTDECPNGCNSTTNLCK